MPPEAAAGLASSGIWRYAPLRGAMCLHKGRRGGFVFGRRFNESDTPTTPEFQVNAHTTGHQRTPVAIAVRHYVSVRLFRRSPGVHRRVSTSDLFGSSSEARNASAPPPEAGWNGATVGKSAEVVRPVTWAREWQTAMPRARSEPLPPR